MKKHDENYMKQNKILKIGVLIFFLGEILSIFILFTFFNKGID
jgi:hypothetical protein